MSRPLALLVGATLCTACRHEQPDATRLRTTLTARATVVPRITLTTTIRGRGAATLLRALRITRRLRASPERDAPATQAR